MVSKHAYLIVFLILLATVIISCDADSENSDLAKGIEIGNSIFYATKHIDPFNNNNNFSSFYVYNTVNEATIKLSVELHGNTSNFQLVGYSLYFIQSNILKSYDLLDNVAKTYVDVPPGTTMFSISHNGNFLAYKSNNQIVIVDLKTNLILDTIENQNAINLSWSPTNSQLLIPSQPSEIYDVNKKALVVSLENVTPQFEQWKKDGQHLFYKLYSGDATPYVVHKLESHSVDEIPTSKNIEIYDGKFSPDEKYFAYIHTPRSTISNFHYLDVLTNVDITIEGGTEIIANYDWFPESDNKVLISSSYSLFIYNLSGNTLEKTIDVIDHLSDKNTFITFVKNL